MLNLVFDDAKLFKRTIDAISVLVDQGEFIIDEKGMSLRAADQAMIAMVDFTIPKSAFSEYVVQTHYKLGIDLEGLAKVLARARPNDKLVLGLSEDNALLTIELRGNASRSFTLPLLDISGGDLPMPNMEFDAEMTIDADLLQDGLKDASLFNTYVTLKARDHEFQMLAKGTSGNLNFKLGKQDKSMKHVSVKAESSASFPLDYLQDITKSAAKDDGIKIAFKTNRPLMVTYKIEKAALIYYIAPRAEAE
ncbi:MAG: proliferating cell nuclear antigen (pcna) [Candidatus Diapherotrites archaeon]|nr:proliferating cell nuclear antigen (pcna) [Candidatus Diapherotrites archaeon]